MRAQAVSETYTIPVRRLGAEGAEQAGTIEVAAADLGGKVRPRLLHEACLMYEANRRVGTHKTRTRAELAYANRKPWRQKGTGRARAGTRRSPLWRGGGTIFGPRPRDYSWSMPKKARRRATQSALLSKLRDGEAIVLEQLPVKDGKTREVAAALRQLGLQGKRVTLLVAEYDPVLVRASRNLPDLQLVPAAELNAYVLLRNKWLLATREGLERALELWRGEPARTAGAAAKAAGPEPAHEEAGA
ncbi:MAG: 50S ribosomal protein L4 [Planctomycetota bacterium]|nr:MAG: 50S ribosomal protein L4 [Planctomycetota bacterium]